MHRFEHGGCCLERQQQIVSAIFPTKADQILSKYRPIAPKPLVPRQEKDLAFCSNIAPDSSKNTGQLVSGSKQNRARKRSTASSFSSRASKRSCTRSRLDRTWNSGPAVVLPSIKPKEDFPHSGTEARSSYGTASKVSYPALNSQSPTSTLGPPRRPRPSAGSSRDPVTAVRGMKAFSPGESEQMGSKGMAERGTTSTDRAAEKVSLAVPAIIYSDIAAINVPLRSRGCGGALAETVYEPSNIGTFGGEKCLRCSRLPPFLATLSCHGFAEEEASSGENSSSNSKELVTLPLLPDQPLLSNSANELSLPSNNDGDYEDHESDASYLTELRLCGGIESYIGKEDACSSVTDRHINNMPAMAARNENENKVDVSFLNQTYMASHDAVMLVGEADQVLWSNAAFKKAMAERPIHIDHYPQPYIDVLGMPVFLAYHSFQPFPGAPQCKGILWGFLKKLMFHSRDTLQQQDFSGCANLLPSPFLDGLNRSSDVKPIAPQAVGSTITLECITEVCQASVPTIIRKFEHAKEQLEQSPLPAVVVDALSRVRYVNSAYKKMIGQPEFLWLAKTMSDPSSSASQRLAGEVSLVCVNDQPPLNAASFSCRVSIHWIDAATSKSVTVPCDVCKLVGEDDQSVYAWRFHVTAADLYLKNLGG
ncbi:hypothetical protein O6H91_05G120500 [Diphasiastrum complanatum]|uniref:Uncharacterized protein n=1 Tax=Diphasiastrum complanatum TaxID=34168 RepID=A0ACC2DT25_DIPCM|nr:hypothetical protein O6H91_05G120500 [Diphasiastrum complanatum]